MISSLMSMLPDEDELSGDDFQTYFSEKKPTILNHKSKLQPGASFVKKDGSAWTTLDGTTFVVRSGPDYARNKLKKESKPSFYECVGVDCFASKHKIPNIGRFFYSKDSSDKKQRKKVDGKEVAGTVPERFVFQMQLPDYPPSMIKSQSDGEGYSLVFHFKLTKEGRKKIGEAKEPAATLLTRFLDAVREGGGPQSSEHPLYLRPKVIMRLMNHEKLGLGFVHRKICENFNAKPFLSRPEHTFHVAPDNSYLEIDVDVHRFKYFQKRCAHSFRDNFRKAKIDIGIVIEGQGDEEMPEQMLAACTIERAHHENFLLVVDEEAEKRRVAEAKKKEKERKEREARENAPAAPTGAPPPPPGASGADRNEERADDPEGATSLSGRLGHKLGLW